MAATSPLVSFCIPVYNEASVIESSTAFIGKNLAKLTKNHFEIILVDNGSTDETYTLIKKLAKQYTFVRGYTVGKKGHGLAYKKSIQVARGSILVLGAIDIPFGFSDFMNAMKVINEYDLIYASKRHKKSHFRTTWQRKLSTIIFNTSLKLFFRIPLSDTQGTMIMKKDAIMPILKYCDADDAFFSAQVAIYGLQKGLAITEVPVTENAENEFNRKSKYHIFRDGSIMFQSMYREWKKLKKTRESR